MKEKEIKQKNEQQKKERMFDIKINKQAMEKFMARFFWYFIAAMSVLAIVLFVMSTVTLYNTFAEVWEPIYNAWVMIRTPLITNILCLAWLWIVYVFIKLIRE